MKKAPFPDKCCNCRYAERAYLRGDLDAEGGYGESNEVGKTLLNGYTMK